MLKGCKILIALFTAFTLFNCSKEIEDPYEEQFKKDKAIMDQYIAENKLTGVFLTRDIFKEVIAQPFGTQIPKVDEGLKLGYITQLLNGTVIDTTFLIYQHGQKFYSDGWELGVGTMKEGEYSRFLLPSYYGYGNQTKLVNNVTVPANSVLSLDVQLQDIIPTENLPSEYAIYKGLTPIKRTSGLVYSVTTAGNAADSIEVGKTVILKYKGYLLNGYVFDESNSYTLIAGGSREIAGWREAIPLLNKGDKATIVIPSTLAYGASGSFNSRGQLVIPPNAVIAFDVEILDVK